MNKEEIFTKLQDIMVELFELDRDKITLSANLYEDLDIDSIDAVDLAVKVRELTGNRIDPDNFKQVRTMQDLVDTAEKMFNQ